MLKLQRLSVIHYGIILLVCAGVLLLWPGLLTNFFATQGYDPHGTCYLWEPNLVGLFVITDSIIGVSYVVISVTLAFFVYRTRRDVPFHWVFLAFGGFIIACGATHFMDVMTVWLPAYWVSGYLRLITAFASAATAIILQPILPRAFTVIRAAKSSEQHLRDLEREIQERKRVEAALKEAQQALETKVAERTAELEQAVRTRDEFLAVAAHELKTPITSMRGFAQLLMRQYQKKGEIDPDNLILSLGTIDVQSVKLTTLIARLLDVSRLEAGQLALERKNVDVAELVRNSVAAAQNTTLKHTITLKSPTTLTASVDVLRLEQVLTNLLNNAIKFSPETEAIEVTLLMPDDQTLQIAVRDYGVGIPVERRTHIFDRYYQGHGEGYLGGMGLGLYISREIIKLHGGRIEVQFPADGGTRFVVSLPLVA